MKKIFALLAFVAMTMTASAQGAAGLKTFDCKLFSCQYPANFEPQEQWMDEAFNAKIEDDIEFFSASYMAGQDMTVQQLKDWGEGMRGLVERSMGEPTGWKAGPISLKGKTITFRSEGEEEVWDSQKGEDVKIPAVKLSYCVVQPGKKIFSGELKFKKKDEAKYKVLFTKILTSFKGK